MQLTVYKPGTPTDKWTMPLQNEAEYRAVKSMCFSGRSVSPLSGCLFPVRTNTLCNFSQDFFFPTLYHGASKVGCCAQRIIENLVYLLLDLITFPIRVVTGIPLAIHNARQKEHLFLTYLKQHDAPKQFIDADRVRVELKANFGDESQFKELNEITNEEQIIEYQTGELTVHFASVPEALFSRGCWMSVIAKKRQTFSFTPAAPEASSLTEAQDASGEAARTESESTKNLGEIADLEKEKAPSLH